MSIEKKFFFFFCAATTEELHQKPQVVLSISNKSLAVQRSYLLILGLKIQKSLYIVTNDN